MALSNTNLPIAPRAVPFGIPPGVSYADKLGCSGFIRNFLHGSYYV